MKLNGSLWATRDTRLVAGFEWELKNRGRIWLPNRVAITRNAQFIGGKGEKGAWVKARAK